MNLSPILCLLLLLPTIGLRAEEAIDDSTPARAIASLTDPKKLATLKSERASNPRFQKCLYWLAIGETMFKGSAEFDGMLKVIEEASRLNKTFGTPYATAIRDTFLANYMKALNYGIFNSAGLEELKQGKSATITEGEYAGQEATADHRIPRAVCPELDNQIFNLQLLPSKLNSAKGDKVQKEQVEQAEFFHKNGLLSDKGLEAVKKAYKKEASAQPPQTAESEDEKQARMNEESKQMELELVRAERKGTEAVYEVWVERLKKLGRASEQVQGLLRCPYI